MESEDQAKIVQKQGIAASSGTKGSTIANMLVNLLLSGSFSLVWGFVNGLQIVCHMGLFDVRRPGSVDTLIDYFSDLATFKFLDAGKMTQEWTELPEVDSFSLQF